MADAFYLTPVHISQYSLLNNGIQKQHGTGREGLKALSNNKDKAASYSLCSHVEYGIYYKADKC